MTKQCPSCLGIKQLVGMGCLVITCSTCNGVGFVKDESTKQDGEDGYGRGDVVGADLREEVGIGKDSGDHRAVKPRKASRRKDAASST